MADRVKGPFKNDVIDVGEGFTDLVIKDDSNSGGGGAGGKMAS